MEYVIATRAQFTLTEKDMSQTSPTVVDNYNLLSNRERYVYKAVVSVS